MFEKPIYSKMDALFALSIDKYYPNDLSYRFSLQTFPMVSRHKLFLLKMCPKEHIPLRNDKHNDLYQVFNIIWGTWKHSCNTIQEIYNHKIQVNNECLIMYRPELIRVYAIEREVEEMIVWNSALMTFEIWNNFD